MSASPKRPSKLMGFDCETEYFQKLPLSGILQDKQMSEAKGSFGCFLASRSCTELAMNKLVLTAYLGEAKQRIKNKVC